MRRAQATPAALQWKRHQQNRFLSGFVKCFAALVARRTTGNRTRPGRRSLFSRQVQRPARLPYNPGMPSAVAARPVVLGIDRLLESDRRLIDGRRIGVVSNPASVDRGLRHTVDRLFDAADVQVTALFGPQHGFRSDVQDNMIETPHGRDARRRVPVYSLYSETREPTAEMLRDLDVLVIDLQDVGTRIYTYIYTMANCLRAAARHGVQVVVCDRPNPIGGGQVEGACSMPACDVVRRPVPDPAAARA